MDSWFRAPAVQFHLFLWPNKSFLVSLDGGIKLAFVRKIERDVMFVKRFK